MKMPRKGNEHRQVQPKPYCFGHVPPGALMVLGPFCCVSHLWRFFVRFAVESAYPSALQEFVIGWSRLTGFPLELSAVTGFVGHFLLRRLVLGLGFYSFHRLDVYPWSELISEDEKKEKGSGIKTRKIAVIWEQPPHCSNWEGFCPHPVRFTKKKKDLTAHFQPHPIHISTSGKLQIKFDLFDLLKSASRRHWTTHSYFRGWNHRWFSGVTSALKLPVNSSLFLSLGWK